MIVEKRGTVAVLGLFLSSGGGDGFRFLFSSLSSSFWIVSMEMEFIGEGLYN